MSGKVSHGRLRQVDHVGIVERRLAPGRHAAPIFHQAVADTQDDQRPDVERDGARLIEHGFFAGGQQERSAVIDRVPPAQGG